MSDGKIWSDVVLKAMEQIEGGVYPTKAYQNATKLLGLPESMQSKGCPKNAFLGLCSEGYIKGVAKGSYEHSYRVKSYAVDAVKLLIANPGLERYDDDRLWAEMAKVNVYQQEKPRKNGSQGEMAVVRTLWSKGLINK
jgi:hypothetical protein